MNDPVIIASFVLNMNLLHSRSVRWLLAATTCIVMAFPLLAQEGKTLSGSPPFQHFSMDDGLPSMRVFQVIQDSKGYLWLATDHGVCRFDGQGFKTYTTQDGLPENETLNIYEDDAGRVWFGHYSGVISYLFENRIHTVEFTDSIKSYISSALPCGMYLGANDTLWVALTKGDARFLKVPVHDPAKAVFVMYDRLKGTVLQRFNDRDFLYSRAANGRFPSLLHVKGYGKQQHIGPKPGFKKWVYNGSACRSQTGDILCAFGGRLYEIKSDSIIERANFGRDADLGMFQDQQENTFVPLFNGGVLVYRNGNYALKPDTLLTKYLVTSVIQDHEGGHWFTTHSSGVFYTSSLTTTCIVDVDALDLNRLVDVSIHQSGALATQYSGEMLLWTQDQNAIRAVAGTNLSSTSKPVWLNDSLILLFDTTISRTLLYNWVKGSIKVTESTLIPRFVFQCGNGNYVQFTASGIYRYDPTTQESEMLSAHRQKWYDGICYDGEIWFSDAMGIHQLVNGEQTDPLSGFNGQRIKALDFVQLEEYLVIATDGDGLIVVDTNDNAYVVTEQDGLASNICLNLAVDSTGTLWVSSNSGLTRIRHLVQGAEPEMKIMVGKSHLLSDQITYMGMVKEHLWLWSNVGLTILDPYQGESGYATNTYIQSVFVSDSLVGHDTSFILGYDQRNLKVNFSALTYSTPELCRFRYRMIGTDSSWSTTDRNSIQYSGLQPGKYRFEVRVADPKHLGRTAVFSFSIAPPYWKTWWFISLAILLSGIALILAYSYQIRRIRFISNLRSAMIESEQKALRAQITPHFVFNTINSILALISQRQNEQADKALHRFAGLMRKTLNYSSKSRITLQEEISALKLYLELEQLRFDESLSFEINSDVPEAESILIPPMIIQPFVENAIKHGLNHKKDGTKKLEISFHLKDEVMTCTITDNGIGRKASQNMHDREKFKHSGMGIGISQDRIDLFNRTSDDHIDLAIRDLEGAEGKATGTEVTLTMKFRTI